MKVRIKLFMSDGETEKGFPVRVILTYKGKRKNITISHSFLNQWNELKQLQIDVLPVKAPFISKSVRYRFATIAKFKMIDVDIIRELMGHERNDIDTIYKNLYPEEVRDAAHFKIIS